MRDGKGGKGFLRAMAVITTFAYFISFFLLFCAGIVLIHNGMVWSGLLMIIGFFIVCFLFALFCKWYDQKDPEFDIYEFADPPNYH